MNRNRLIATFASTLLAIAAFGAFADAQIVLPGSAPPEGGEALPKLSIAQELGLSGLSFGGSEKHLNLFASFTVQKGSRRGMLSVAATIDPGWHTFSITQLPGATSPSKLTVKDTAEYKLLGKFQADREPHSKRVEYYRVPVEEHEGTVTWTAPIEFADGVNVEQLSIPIKYEGQVCGASTPGAPESCIPITEDLQAAFSGYTDPPASPGEYRPDPAQAQVVITGHIEPAAVAPGGKAKLILTATPIPEWHIYAYATKDPDQVGVNKPTLIYLAPLPNWTRSPVKASVAPKEKPAAIAGLPNEKHHTEPVTWTIDLAAPADSPAGEVVLTGYMGFQTCKEGCLPPHAVQFRASIPVKQARADGKIPLEFTAVKRAADGPPAAVSSYRDVAKLVAENPVPTGELNVRSLLPMLGFGLLGGLILNLMPCVLPVIGLKVLSFVQQGGQSRGKIFVLNVWFVLGLMLVFFVLASLATFGSLIPGIRQDLSWGQQFTLTWFKVAMVVVVFAFALSFLGVWEVPIPGFAQSSSSSKLQQQEGPAGAFFKGIFTTLLATPCSGPFLGSVFGYTLSQPPLATYLIFGSVGLGMASPYLVIGAFPGLVKWLPKPGAWMETFKQLMGFVLLFTVVYLFSTISPGYYIATLTLVVGVWFACWVIGRVPIYEDAGKQLRAWAIGAMAAAAVGWFAFTFLGPVKHLYEWKPFTPEVVAKLQSEGKTVMVDFTADWCPTCQTNFHFAINTRAVKALVEKNGVEPVLADWSDHNDMIKQKLAELQSNSIPVLAIYPANQPGEVIILRDALTQKQLLGALEQAGPSEGRITGAQQPISDKLQARTN
jgi:suppressor for copper-sensitivity B